MSGPRKEWYVNLNTRRETPCLLVSSHVFFCFLNIHVLTFDIVFDNFPKISDHFHKISEDSQKDFWGLETNVSSHFPKISKAFQRFSKITGDRQRFPSMIQWWFVHITTHLSAILRDLFCNHNDGDCFTHENYNCYNFIVYEDIIFSGKKLTWYFFGVYIISILISFFKKACWNESDYKTAHALEVHHMLKGGNASIQSFN